MLKRVAAPSAHDVARLAGVSQAAVSRAFTPGASISKAMKEKVLRAAQTLGYRPNLIARSLIKGQSGIVGVIIGNPTDSFFMAALDALSKRLSRAGKHILIVITELGAPADEHVEDLLEYRVDALLLMAAGISSNLSDQCRKEGIPVLFFCRRPDGADGSANGKGRRGAHADDSFSVSGNDREGTRQIAGHLLQQGYRNLGFLGGPAESPTSRDRESAFTAYVKAQGLPPPVRVVGAYHRDGAVRAAREILSLSPRPDAVFCVNDFVAMTLIDVARHEFGLEIGREIGVAGFDDRPMASWPTFDLTTYSQPVDTMIDQAAEILLASPDCGRPVQIVVDGVLQLRGSTRRGLADAPERPSRPKATRGKSGKQTVK